MLLGLGLGVIALLGVVELWMVFGFALGLGIAAAFDAPARQAFVGELVDDASLSNAVALNSASFNVARLIGPAVAGLLVAAVGSGWVFVINAVTFVAVLLSIWALRPAEFTRFARKAARQGPDARRLPLRAAAARHPARLRDGVPDRHPRLQLPDLHLDDGERRVR